MQRMQHSFARRAVLGVLATVVLAPLVACGQDDSADASASGTTRRPAGSGSEAGPGAESGAKPYTRELEDLERKFDARLGVYAIDTGSGREVVHNDKERFSYASTFKALAAGAVLHQHTPDGMEKVIRYSEDDLLEYAPVTEKHVRTGMTLTELCDAAVRYSDNTAANLLLKEIGGPEKLEAVLEKEAGDDVTEMNRYEPGLNDWAPGSERDTSTPRAMAGSLRAFVLGDVLDEPDREQLTTWLRGNTTGDTLIRAGVPEDWKVGDKTGMGGVYGTRNDIAVVWPPDADPIVMAVMTNRDEKDAEPDDKLIAEAASVVADSLS